MPIPRVLFCFWKLGFKSNLERDIVLDKMESPAFPEADDSWLFGIYSYLTENILTPFFFSEKKYF